VLRKKERFREGAFFFVVAILSGLEKTAILAGAECTLRR
jgi:hypothetical protein